MVVLFYQVLIVADFQALLDGLTRWDVLSGEGHAPLAGRFVGVGVVAASAILAKIILDQRKKVD